MSNVKISTFSPYNDNSVGSFQFSGGTLNAVLTDGITAIGTNNYTLECWVYHTSISGQQTYVSDTYGNTNGVYFYKDSSHQLGTYYTGQIATSSITISNKRWYHVAVVRNGTGSGNVKQYINGVEAGSGTDSTNLTDTAFSVGESEGTTSNEMVGYITDVRLVVGSSSSAAIYTSAFTPPTTALTNVSGTGYSAYVLMQPGKNSNLNGDTAAPEDRKEFAAIAAGLGQEPQTVLNEGTQITSSGADTATYSYQSAMCVPALPEGKWYFEVRDLFYYLDIGLMSGRFDEGVGSTNYIANNNRGTSLRFAPYSGKLRFTATGLSSNDDYHTIGIGATGTAPGTGDIYGIDFDTITNTFGVSKNGGTRYTHVVPTSDFVMLGKNIGMSDGTSGNQGNLQLNFGQNPTFNGNITPSGGTNSDGSYPDADGIGGFRYAPPTGYKALRFTGTTRPSGLNKPALNPDEYFDMLEYVGIEQAKRIRGLKFKPGLVWLKAKDYAQDHLLFDSVRGFGRNINSNAATAEEDNSNALSAFEDDGFSLGTSGEVQYPDKNYIAWCWKAGDDLYVNTDGTITSTVSVNVDAGFSIVNWVGTGSAGTIGHGLSQIPELMWVKPLSTANSWVHYDKVFGGTHYMALQTTQATSANSTRWNDTSPTSKVFSVGNHVSVSDSNNRHIAYLWHSVEGYSKIGSYEANNNADGPFIYTGFKPAWVIIKSADSSTGQDYASWTIVDNKRDTNNFFSANKMLFANRSYAEGKRGDGTSASDFELLDLVSNGFKHRSGNYEANSTAPAVQTYIYMAFAETPSAFTNSR